MNPLSAFSFGQLIKTFLPGLIASTSPLLVLETLYELRRTTVPASWLDFLRQSFTYRVVSPNLAGSVTLLVLVALLLGFSLNSIHWMFFHELCRGRCTSKELKEMKGKLKTIVKRTLGEVMPGSHPELDPSVEGFFLHKVDLAKLTFLRESYFAWYEFHMNSLMALILVVLTFICTSLVLAIHWQVAWSGEAMLVLSVILACAGAIAFLWKAALRNLTMYEVRLFWFLIGTLSSGEKNVAPKEAEDELSRDPFWMRLLVAFFRGQAQSPGRYSSS